MIQNHKDYALARFSHLNDDKVYKTLDVDLTEDICFKVQAFLDS